MEVENLRITKLRNYLMEIINTMIDSEDYQINANYLSQDINNYSLDKIPTNTEVQRWVIGTVIRKDIYSFRSRMLYSPDSIENLKNIGFYEDFERIINSNNEKGILPDIENIESIECLNCGTMSNEESQTATFDIQIQIIYREE